MPRRSARITCLSSKLLFSARYGYKYVNDKGNTYGKDNVPYFVYKHQLE